MFFACLMGSPNPLPSKDPKEDDDDEADAGDGAEPMPEPRNKKEFYKLRAESNTTVLVDKCLQDRTLQLRLRMVSKVGRFAQYEYAHGLTEMKDGPEGMKRFSANRATYRWYREEIVPLFGCLHDPSFLRELDFTMGLEEPFPKTYQARWFLEEKDLAKLLKTLVVNLAKEEMWSQQMFPLTLPHALAALMSHDDASKRATLMYLAEFTEALIAAEELVASNPKTHAKLESLLASALFTKQQFAREILCQGLAEGWTLDNRELLDIATAMVEGSSTTADCLEKCFAHMQDVCRLIKAPKIDNYHLWFTASSSPYTKTGGMGEIMTKLPDYMNAARQFSADRAAVDKMLHMKQIHGSISSYLSLCQYAVLSLLFLKGPGPNMLKPAGPS